MRLLLVIDSLTSGGAQRQFVNLAVELSRRGHSVHVFVYHDIDFFEPLLRRAGVEIIKRLKRRQFESGVIRRLADVIRELEPHAIIAFLTVPSIYAILARKLVRGAPPLIVSHRASSVGEHYRWRDRLAMRLYRLADHTVANSHHMREFLVENYPALRGRASTIWNGVDASRFSFAPRPEPTETIRLITVGHLAPRKNLLCLANALAHLRDKRRVDATVTHVGRLQPLSPREESHLGQVNAYLASAGLTDRWTWLGEREDLAELLYQHDALVHPAVAEGLPNVVCEALACGCPPIVADTLDHPLLVQEGTSGLLFAPSDAKDLADTLCKFHKLSASERQALGSAAREFAVAQLSLEKYADAYERLLEQLLNSPSATAPPPA